MGGGWVRPKRSARQLRGSAPGSRDAKALPGASAVAVSSRRGHRHRRSEAPHSTGSGGRSRVVSPDRASLPGVGLSRHIVSGPTGPLVRIWSAECDSATGFSSIASVNPGIGFARIGGRTAVHLRGPATRATPLSCPPDTEYFGVDFRLGAYLPMFPPVGLVNLNDAVLPTLPDGRVLLDGDAWEMPTPTNVDVFVQRLVRAGLLVVDPLVEDLRHGDVRGMAARTAQSRFVRAVGLSRRRLHVIERARRAARQLRAGTPIADVIFDAGYHDQPHLTRSLQELVGYTPGEVARGDMFLDL